MSVSGTPIILWCLIHGAIFKITIGRDDDIYELKEAIKKVTEPVLDIFSLLQLKLLKLKNPVNDKHISDIQNLSLQDDENENDNVTLMKDIFSVAKQSYNEIDRTNVICNALLQLFSFVSSRAGDLTSLINVPLTRKLPVSKNKKIKYPLLANFIETKNNQYRSDLSTYISGLIIGIRKQNLSNTSENILHWGVDSIIRIPLQIFYENLGERVLLIDMDQNSKNQEITIIGNKRSDFLYWANNVLLFKGKEKVVIEDFSIAMNELEEKFNKSSNTNSPSCLIVLSNQLDINNR
ncbi:18417_t:CDS:2 [Gigaspora margarita]|uniref:18417_t:CDS:1 n=1 Tax=Gigaspora margarita TaxID=4874 RepID=A0ABN7V0S1_GIGMA|nr:18417_t:CDS:2 [Gigaspora margarita]